MRKPALNSILMAAALCGGLFSSACQGQSNLAGDVLPSSLRELQESLSNHVCNPEFLQATFAVKIVSAKTGETIFEHDASELLSPASNTKLYTTALALDRLGPDFRIRTSVYAQAAPQEGVIAGDLIVFGRGDPSINARRHGGDLLNCLQPLIQGLTNRGVKEVRGDLVCDQSFFTGPEHGSGWAREDLQKAFGAELSALSINDNVVSVRVQAGAQRGEPCVVSTIPVTTLLQIANSATTGPSNTVDSLAVRCPNRSLISVSGRLAVGTSRRVDLPMPDPAAFFAEQFRSALGRAGIKISGQTKTADWQDTTAFRGKTSNLLELAHMDSPPLRDIVRDTQKLSQNLYADLLLAQVGESSRKGSGPELTSEQQGVRELQKFLKAAGIAASDFYLEEGSGLSRNNLTTARATVALLQHMSKHPAADVYWAALPVAGVDGTLRNRLGRPPALGNIRAKTGSLKWASSLSGDVKTAAGERLLFSIMLNRYLTVDPQNSAADKIDRIVETLAAFAGRVDE